MSLLCFVVSWAKRYSSLNPTSAERAVHVTLKVENLIVLEMLRTYVKAYQSTQDLCAAQEPLSMEYERSVFWLNVANSPPKVKMMWSQEVEK